MESNPEVPENAIGKGTLHGVGVVGLPVGAEADHLEVSSLVSRRVKEEKIDSMLGQAALDFVEMVDDALEYRGNARGRVERAPSIKPLNFLVHKLPQGGHLFILMAQDSNKNPETTLNELNELGVKSQWISEEIWAASYGKVQMPVMGAHEAHQVIIPFDEGEDKSSAMLTEAALDARQQDLISDKQLMDILDYISYRELKRGKIYDIEVVEIFSPDGEFGNGIMFTFPQKKKSD